MRVGLLVATLILSDSADLQCLTMFVFYFCYILLFCISLNAVGVSYLDMGDPSSEAHCKKN